MHLKSNTSRLKLCTGCTLTCLRNVAAVSEEELHCMRMHGINRLRNVDEVDLVMEPQHVVFTQVGMYQTTRVEHCLNVLQNAKDIVNHVYARQGMCVTKVRACWLSR